MTFRIVAIAIVCLQFILLPALGAWAWAGAEAAGYFEPARVIPSDANEGEIAYWQAMRRHQQDIRNAGLGCGLFAGFLTALSFCTSAPLRARRPILHLFAVALAMPVAHVLWTEPFWGFHHTQAFGILVWFVVGSEDGRVIGPTCVAPLTLVIWVGFVVLTHVLLHRIVNWLQIVNWRDLLKQGRGELEALKEDLTS